jgi:hypothetical protein
MVAFEVTIAMPSWHKMQPLLQMQDAAHMQKQNAPLTQDAPHMHKPHKTTNTETKTMCSGQT